MTAEGCHPEAELSIVIGDDEWIQELNRTYRKKNKPTDVLAFPQDISPVEATVQVGRQARHLRSQGPLLGDVAVSAETAARQAEEAGHSFEEELALLVTHGILHLTGWSDETAEKRKRMMQRALLLLEKVAQS